MKKKQTVGRLFINTLKFSKFLADVSIAQEIQNFNNFNGSLQIQNLTILIHSWLFSNENVMNNITAS